MRLYKVKGSRWPHLFLREQDDWGLKSYDLVRAAQRFWADDTSRLDPLVRASVDAELAERMPSSAELLAEVSDGDNLSALTRRSLARLNAWYLIAEDPQRRLESRDIATLAHQASLVRHVLDNPNLRRVMIADEVGLGKTIEAALILQELLETDPGLRILYLAPARLVSNVRREFDRMGMAFRSWVSGNECDGTLDDARIIASIHRASHPSHLPSFRETNWDVIVVDECHHLSDWAAGGGKPVRKYVLVKELQEQLPASGRLILLSGTPHQGHRERFENLVDLLRQPGQESDELSGRVIYRTKEDVSDWEGNPLFPRRQVNEATVLNLTAKHQAWLEKIHGLFDETAAGGGGDARTRAAGWRAGQALQWATSSIHAGLGYLVRQAIRAEWVMSEHLVLQRALESLRPYRGGPRDEHPGELLERIRKEVGRQADSGDVEDIEETEECSTWRPDPALLREALENGIHLLETEADTKWELIDDRLLSSAGDEKVVLFAQPIETVTALAGYLERKTGMRTALIVGNQKEEARQKEIDAFWRDDGPQYLISSRAGGEGLNLQVARRLIHVDVPWNPMELEQRVGRVHRFMSRRTILVDTVVMQGSREEDMYAVARRKLEEIAASMVPEDKLEMLFSRVMALVPPNELSSMLGERPLGPLSNEERARVSSMVSAGFERWQDFDDTYSSAQRNIRSLDAGEASWRDMALFAKRYLSAEPAEGFNALRFRLEDGEVKEASAVAEVLSIASESFACGDYGGMPVTHDDGTRARQLGINIRQVAEALREHGLTDAPCGAAHLRWSREIPDMLEIPSDRPVLVLTVARQSVRSSEGSWSEAGLNLQTHVFAQGEPRRSFSGRAQAGLFRALWAAGIRSKRWEAGDLLSNAARWHDEVVQEAGRPTEADRAASARHAAFVVFAGIVGP